MQFHEFPKWVTPKGRSAVIVQDAAEELRALGEPASKDGETGKPARDAFQLGAAAREVGAAAAKAAKAASTKSARDAKKAAAKEK